MGNDDEMLLRCSKRNWTCKPSSTRSWIDASCWHVVSSFFDQLMPLPRFPSAVSRACLILHIFRFWLYQLRALQCPWNFRYFWYFFGTFQGRHAISDRMWRLLLIPDLFFSYLPLSFFTYIGWTNIIFNFLSSFEYKFAVG